MELVAKILASENSHVQTTTELLAANPFLLLQFIILILR